MNRKNLAVRKSDGIMVLLNWYPDENACEVIVNTASGDDVVFNPPNEKALDAFYHPYVYAPELAHVA
jgi:hypothetical protein